MNAQRGVSDRGRRRMREVAFMDPPSGVESSPTTKGRDTGVKAASRLTPDVQPGMSQPSKRKPRPMFRRFNMNMPEVQIAR